MVVVSRVPPGIEEVKPGEPTAPVVAGVLNGRPREAILAIWLMIAGGAVSIALSVYWMLWGGNALGGFLVLLLGIAYMYGGRALRAGESWGWGAGVFAGVFYVFFGLFMLPLAAILIVLAIVVMFLLYRVRDYFGMVRYDPEEEERRKKELETQRTSNPEGLHCPRCGSTRLWVAPDGSAFCQECRTGTISLRRLAETVKPS
jgi:hypothetical protein